MDVASMQSRFEERIFGFQQVAGAELLKKKQENYAVELRKKIRSQNTTKRRAVVSGHSFLLHYSEKENVSVGNLPFHLIKMNPELASPDVNPIEKLRIIREIMVEDTDRNVLDQGLEVLAGVLKIEVDTPFSTIVYLGFIPILQRLMDYKYPTPIVLNATMCLANICNGPHEYASHVFKLDGIHSFLRIISSRNIQPTIMAIRGLANLCGDCYEFSTAIIESNLINQLSQLLENCRDDNLELMAVISHLARNITQNADDISIEQIDKIVQWIGKLIIFQDPEIKDDCLKALRNISKCEDNKKIELILENNLGEFCVQSLGNYEENLLKNASKIIANFFALDIEITQQLLDCGVLDKLLQLINHPSSEIRRSVYLALSNILCGTNYQKTKYLDHEIAAFSMRGLEDADANVKLECSTMLKNFINTSEYGLTLKLIELRIFDYLKNALDNDIEPDFLNNILSICDGLLEAGKQEQYRIRDVSNQIALMFEESGCLDVLENIIGNMEVGDIFQYAQQIHEEYFGQSFDSTDTKIYEVPAIFEFS
ncbi:unnamed protein product [Blepharisma stoltei]|uniref:Importin subunit alpha n=1 Tax=Blepharisma stoltei TaxID=1481888 RepID=A0AAU9IKD8_9CILI|nr:unnamed protein product [Blepharisma stoltei]